MGYYLSVYCLMLINFLPLFFLTLFSFRKRLKFSFVIACIITIMYSAILCGAILYTLPTVKKSSLWHFSFSIIGSMAYMIIFVGMANTGFFPALFTLFFIKTYMNLVVLSASILQSYIVISDFNWTIVQIRIFFIFISLIFSLPFIVYLIEKWIRPILDTDNNRPFWKYLWTIPVSYYLVFRLNLFPHNTNVACNQHYSLMLLIVWGGSIYLTYYSILKMIVSVVNNEELKNNLQISNIQIAMQKEQYNKLQHSIEEIKHKDHDMRHQLLVLKSYLQNNDYTGLEYYLNNYIDTFITAVGPICENSAVNAIVQYYLGIAKKNNTEVTASLKLPKKLPLPESDLCLILGNLLENAEEACIRQTASKRFIQVKAAVTGPHMIAITVQNSYEGAIKYSNNTFLSSKRNDEGIGIASVRSIVNKYHGIIKIEYENQIFRVYILLTL